MNQPNNHFDEPELQSIQNADETVDHRPESTIFGDYELLEEVARGGMGVVYKARQVSLDRIVAIKVILTGTEASADELARFRSEAQSAARLDHPYIVPVYGYGSMEGRPYLAMGLVDGPSMSAIIARHGRMDPTVAAELMLKVAQAIDFAHTQQVVHRDMKPGNVLVDSSGDPRITDFGLAKRQDSDQGLTATGQVLGTPAYMAPEQAAGLDVGASADIYSLGATLYAAITGKPPFIADSIPVLLMKVAEELPTPPHAMIPSIPKSLSDICMRALAKEPADRYPTAGELAEDLGRFLAGRTIARPKRNRQSVSILIVVSVVILAAIGIGSYVMLNQDSKESIVASASKLGIERPDVNELTEAEKAWFSAMAAADDALLPEGINGIWDLRYADTAAAYKQAFEQYGLDPTQTIEADRVRLLNKRPVEFVESLINGLERWESAATAAKQTDPPMLRASQTELDSVEWRRSLRFLREDNNPAALNEFLKSLDLSLLSLQQSETLALQLLNQSPDSAVFVPLMTHKLSETHAKSFWIHVSSAFQFMAQARAKPAEAPNFAAEAIGPLRTARLIRPTAIAPARALAEAFVLLGNETAALADQENVEALAFPVAWKRIEVARLWKDQRKWDEAIAEADEACLIAPNSRVAASEAVKYRVYGDRIVENDPAMRRFANAFFSSEEETMKAFLTIYEELAKEGDQPLKSPLCNPELSARRAKAWSAVTHYRENVSYKAYEALSNELNGSGQDPLAASREAVRLNPEGGTTAILHVHHLVQHNGDHAETLATINKSIELDPEGRPVWMDTARALTTARSGDLQRARELFLDARPHPKGVPTHLLLLVFSWGMQFAHANSLQDDFSNDMLERSQPNSVYGPSFAVYGPFFRLLLIADRLEKKEVDKLTKVALDAAESGGNDWWLGLLCQASIRTGFVPGLGLRIASRTEFAPAYHRVPMVLALHALQCGDIHFAKIAAARSSRFLIEGGPSHGDSVTNSEMVRGLTLLCAGDLAEARQCLEPLCRSHKTEDCLATWAWMWTGGYHGDYARLLIKLDKLEEAEQVCREQQRMRPEDANVEWAYGLLELARNQPQSAIPHFQRAAQLDPLNGSIELDWAKPLMAVGESTKAFDHLKVAVARAQRGQMRGFRLIAIEAAETALEISADKAVDKKTRQAVAIDALRWMQADLDHWLQRYQSGEVFDIAAVAQNLPRVLEHPVIERLNAISKVAPLSEVDLQAWNTTLNNARMARDEATKQYAEFPEDRLTHYEEEKKKVNRDVATLILSKGGSITIVTPEKTWLQQHITRAKELPSDGFQITAVSLKDGKVDDQLLAVLERLTTLQHLFLDNTKVTDESVRRIVNRATIRSLNLNGTPVTKDVLEALTGVKTLSLRGTRISPEDLASFAALNPSIDVLPRIESTSTRPLESLSSLPKSFAMRFDGVSRVELPVKCTQGPATSIEAWVWQPLAIFTTHTNPVIGFNTSADGKQRLLGLHTKGRNFFIGESRNANGDFIFTQRVGHFPDEKWMHLAVTLDGGELRVHQDGKRLASTAIALPTDGTQLNFAIGAGPGGGWPFVGIVDEVRISDTARYLDDFDPPRRFEPDKNTLALYQFDEGSGETVHDASGNGHDGKVVGTPEWVPEAEVDK